MSILVFQKHRKIECQTLICSLAHEDANRHLASTTTTVITTEAKAAGATHVSGASVVVGDKTTVTKEASASSHTATAMKQ